MKVHRVYQTIYSVMWLGYYHWRERMHYQAFDKRLSTQSIDNLRVRSMCGYMANRQQQAKTWRGVTCKRCLKRKGKG